MTKKKRQRKAKPSSDDVLQIARGIWGRNEYIPRAETTEDGEFHTFFGCSVGVVLTLWALLDRHEYIPDGGRLQHLLWTLMFLKVYGKLKVLCALAGGIDKETYMNWVWRFLNAIVLLEEIVIVWENRLKNDIHNDCLVSVDGTDFRIPNHGREFASHKYKLRSALRYEIALCILTGDIVWINGPYECGLYNDLMIFRDALLSNLLPGERVEADDGYLGEHPVWVKCPAGFANPPETLAMQARVRHRQETINERFKNFGCLEVVWIHEPAKHGLAVHSIAVILQLTINAGQKLFQCGYRDPPYEGGAPAAVVAGAGAAAWEDGAEDDTSL